MHSWASFKQESYTLQKDLTVRPAVETNVKGRQILDGKLHPITNIHMCVNTLTYVNHACGSPVVCDFC